MGGRGGGGIEGVEGREGRRKGRTELQLLPFIKYLLSLFFFHSLIVRILAKEERKQIITVSKQLNKKDENSFFQLTQATLSSISDI